MSKNEYFKNFFVMVRASFMNNRILSARTLQTNTPGKINNP